jgi:hypothetical protein
VTIIHARIVQEEARAALNNVIDLDRERQRRG